MMIALTEEERRKKNFATHDLVKTGDSDATGPIVDGRNEVVLAFCRKCGGGEAELHDKSCLDRLIERAAERERSLTPLQRAMNHARQRRSWVVGEMQLNDDDTPSSTTREQAMELYAQLPEGALLAELERRMVEDSRHKIVLPAAWDAERVEEFRRRWESLPKTSRILVVAEEAERIAPDGTVRKVHYGAGRQPWDDVVDAGFGPVFAACNVLKYVRRAAAKNGADDLKKARWYFERLTFFRDEEDTSDYDAASDPRRELSAQSCRRWLARQLSDEEFALLGATRAQ